MGETSRLGSENIAKKTRDQLYEPVGRTNTEPCVAEKSPEKTAEPAGVEADGVSTAEEMALSSRPPGEVDSKKYVSVVSSDTFNSFQQNGYHEEEDIDFTPQNGYVEPEEMDTQEAKGTAKGKKAGAPKKDLMGRIQDSIKNARLPSPGEIKDGYLNSAFHKSLHQPLMVKSKVEKTDVQKARQAMPQEKTPAQLGNIDSLSDIPVPTIRKSKGEKIETETDEEPFHFPTNMDEFGQAAYNTLPKSMREQNIVTAVKENLDPEELERNRTLTKTKTPAELAQINSLAEFPVPEKIKHLLAFERKETEPKENKKRRSETASERPTSPQSFKESIYEPLPRSLRETQLVVKEVVEDQDLVKERQELTRTKSPTELSQITSISEFPIPANVENLLKKKSEAESGPELPTPPPRKWKKEDIYESIPSSLRSELVVRSREMEDPEELEHRKELIRTQTPAQLSEIHSLSEIPVPKFIQNLGNSEKKTDEPEAEKVPFSIEKIYETLTPASLMETKLLVKTETEDPEVQAARAEIVKSKSVNELSQITSLADIPIPDAIENFVKKSYAPAERKKKFKEKVKSQSTQSLSQTMYSTLPRSLKQDLLVKSIVEDPDILAERRAVVASKSVSELSQVTSFSDIPIPSNLKRAFHKSMEMLTGFMTPKENADETDIRPITPGGRSITENMYATLPKSLKSELLVKSCVEDPEIQQERMALTQSKSVSELSQIKSLSDIPIPENIEKLISRTATNKTESPEQQSLDSRPG